MNANQAACLEAMEIDRWILRGAAPEADYAPSADEYTLVTSARGDWCALAPIDEAAHGLGNAPTMRLLANIVTAVEREPKGAEFSTVVSTECSDAPLKLAFLGGESLDGWIALPSLGEMLANPQRKRDAWEILRSVVLD